MDDYCLTQQALNDLLFYNVSSYVIAFQREPRVVIYRFVHGARDLAKIF